MINTDSLRTKAIDLAIQGKLTKQLPEDGTADELLTQITAEKKERVKKGLSKREKDLPAVSADEKIFEIPDSWLWCRLGDVFDVSMGQSPKGENLGDEGMEFHQGKIFFGDIFLDESHQYTTEVTRVAYANSVLLCVRAPVGIANITPRDICIGRGLCALLPLAGVDPLYLFYFLRNSRKELEKKGTGSTFSAINVDVVKNYPIPLPPIKEQKRIVQSLNDIFEQVKIIDELQAQYIDNLEMLKKRLISVAIQGKLTNQLEDDGNAEDLFKGLKREKEKLYQNGEIKKEKPLPDITEDETPFSIPLNWRWVRFSDLYSLSNGVASRGSVGGSPHPVLRLADLTSGQICADNIREIDLTDSEFETHRIKKGDLVFIRVNGSRDKVANAFLYLGDEEISYCDHLFCGHKISDLFEPSYVMTVYRSEMVKKQIDPEIKTTAGQNTINQKSMSKILIPLPPVAEQKRIVSKLDELLLSMPQ